MRILMCVSQAPLAPMNGYRIYVAAILQELRKHHEVRVVGVRSRDQQRVDADQPDMWLLPPPVDGRMAKAAAVARSFIRRTPVGTAELTKALSRPLRQELERFRPDVVHVASGRLAGIVPELGSQPRVLAALDAWHLNVEAKGEGARALGRSFHRHEARRVRRHVALMYHRFGTVTVVSDADKQALESVDPSLRIAVIPNGVDVDAYSPDASTDRDPRQIIFTGVMSYVPNVAAAEFLVRQVMPRVHSARPDVRLVIAGRTPTAAVRALGAQDGVEVTGEVPVMKPWLSRSAAYICPMVNGTGIKNKLLEALANGLACVATPLAVQGLAVKHGRHLLIGTHADELAQHLLNVLADGATARSLGEAGRRYVIAEHSWAAVGRKYEQLYAELVPVSGPA